jgi:hypothetical protein
MSSGFEKTVRQATDWLRRPRPHAARGASIHAAAGFLIFLLISISNPDVRPLETDLQNVGLKSGRRPHFSAVSVWQDQTRPDE